MSPRKEDDDSGPSDEEGSSASEQIPRTLSNIEQPGVVNSNGPGEPAAPVSGYESFKGRSNQSPSVSTFKHENTAPDYESLSMPKSRIASKAARGQVLVHYHPQLGDEGFESTLVADTDETSLISSPRGRPMDESSYYSGGGAGMNSRMMDNVRVGRAYNSQQPPSSPMNDHMNDEQNNAATRQIRRRVFRAALERGVHDERRKKMLDADADIGGPSLRAGSTAGTNSNANGTASYYRHLGAMSLTRSRDADDLDTPQSMLTMTPNSYESTPGGESTQQQTISPPAPPAGPPSYRTIIQKLIKDNEPQKLPQLDKVMAKYKGREEELIRKLDSRYKKRKQKSEEILNDLENIKKDKEQVTLAGKRSLEDHGEIKQMNSWDSKKSKDVYFVKVTQTPHPGPVKLPSDIIDSNKTTPHSNVRAALVVEDEEDGDIPAIPQCDAAPADITAAAAANEERLSNLKTDADENVEKDETLSPTNLQEPYNFNMAPSYGDGISVITMETKGTLRTKKNDRGEDTYTWLQRPPNSITVEGGSGSNIQGEESPLSPERKSKINKLLPDFDQEKEEDKAKASLAKLESKALDNVEARILARRKIMETEAKNKAVSGVDASNDVKTKIEKDSGVFLKADDRASIVDDADSFVGKSKPTVTTSSQEDEVQPSLIDQQEILLQATAPQSNAVEEEQERVGTTQTVLLGGGDDDVDDEDEEIDLLLKESRLQAEKAIALRKAQRELEKEKKARMEAEAARIAVEEELLRLKAEVGMKQTMVDDHIPTTLHEENVNHDSNADNVVGVVVEDHADASEVPFKYDLNKTFSSVSDDKSEQEKVEMSRSRSSSIGDMHGDVDATLPVGSNDPQNELDADQESSDDDLSALKYLVLDGGGDSVMAADEVMPTPADDIMEETVDEVKEPSSSILPARDIGDMVSPGPDKVATENMDYRVDQSLRQSATKTSEHDFPSRTMAHAPLSQDASSEKKGGKDEDANINHVATMTFEGNRAKGQLSFTTGSKVLAHSNQRGPWWLGRCGGLTGWFPANAVVPESEFLKNIASALPAEIDESNDRFCELSNEALAETYDLIRNPSDSNNDVEDDEEDDVNSSPARRRWFDDTSDKNQVQSSRSESPPPDRSDPSKMEGLNERLYEPHESSAIDPAPQLGFEGMNRLGKSVEERPEDKPKKTYIGPPQVITETESHDIMQTSPGSHSKKKKKQQEWKAAQDPSTGLTYYYHLKTRETTWEKPPDFDDAADAEKDDVKAKGLSGGKILRIFSKKKKPKTPTDESNVTPSSTFSFDEKKGTFVPRPAAKAAAKSTTGNLVATKTVSNDASGAMIFPEHDDDESSASDASSLFSRESIFTKKKLKSTVGKFTEKFTQKVISPKNSYEQLSGEEEEKMQIEVADGAIELNYPVTSQPIRANPVQWRSAIDATTGKTYYYAKGSTETFWEKPKDM